MGRSLWDDRGAEPSHVSSSSESLPAASRGAQSDSDSEVSRCPGPIESLVIVMELALALILVIFGTYEAVANIMTKWETYGYPFACHCQDIWNTCECSAEHAGMNL